LDDCCLAFGP